MAASAAPMAMSEVMREVWRVGPIRVGRVTFAPLRSLRLPDVDRRGGLAGPVFPVLSMSSVRPR
jgi:hypothetical protein